MSALMQHDGVVDAEALPRRESSQIKNHWGSVAREVKETGKLAITTHQRIEIVMLSPQAYASLVQKARAAETRQQAALDEITARFDANLSRLQAPDTARKIDNIFAARGKTKTAPIAGKSF